MTDYWATPEPQPIRAPGAGDQPAWLCISGLKWRALDPSVHEDYPCHQPTGKRRERKTISKRLEYIPHQAGNAGYFREAARAR